MKANQMSEVCASSHEYIKNLREQNFEGTVAQPTVTGKELTSGQKEKPRSAKRKTSGQKEKPHGRKKNLTAKRKRLVAMAKRITSRQKK